MCWCDPRFTPLGRASRVYTVHLFQGISQIVKAEISVLISNMHLRFNPHLECLFSFGADLSKSFSFQIDKNFGSVCDLESPSAPLP